MKICRALTRGFFMRDEVFSMRDGARDFMNNDIANLEIW